MQLEEGIELSMMERECPKCHAPMAFEQEKEILGGFYFWHCYTCGKRDYLLVRQGEILDEPVAESTFIKECALCNRPIAQRKPRKTILKALCPLCYKKRLSLSKKLWYHVNISHDTKSEEYLRIQSELEQLTNLVISNRETKRKINGFIPSTEQIG